MTPICAIWKVLQCDNRRVKYVSRMSKVFYLSLCCFHLGSPTPCSQENCSSRVSSSTSNKINPFKGLILYQIHSLVDYRGAGRLEATLVEAEAGSKQAGYCNIQWFKLNNGHMSRCWLHVYFVRCFVCSCLWNTDKRFLGNQTYDTGTKIVSDSGIWSVFNEIKWCSA